MSGPFLRGRLAKAYRRFVRHVNWERRARGGAAHAVYSAVTGVSGASRRGRWNRSPSPRVLIQGHNLASKERSR
ncbi:hypothetical protein [Sorangium sp. So ce1000]|uniref:hypothetical protein n=1 Tax=Sorangium sp. So ce1000 TaxID=3133325 RepID=UPI003F63CA73